MLGRHAHLLDLLELGNLKTFDEELATFTTAAHRIRRPHDLWRAEVMRAMRALFDGQLDEGELLARDAFEVGTRLQLSGALQAFVVQTFFLAWQRADARTTDRPGAPVGGCAEQRFHVARIARHRVRERGPRRRGTRCVADVGRRRFRTHRTRTTCGSRPSPWPPRPRGPSANRPTPGRCAIALAPYIDHNTTLSTALALGPGGETLRVGADPGR